METSAGRTRSVVAYDLRSCRPHIISVGELIADDNPTTHRIECARLCIVDLAQKHEETEAELAQLVLLRPQRLHLDQHGRTQQHMATSARQRRNQLVDAYCVDDWGGTAEVGTQTSLPRN